MKISIPIFIKNSDRYLDPYPDLKKHMRSDRSRSWLHDSRSFGRFFALFIYGIIANNVRKIKVMFWDNLFFLIEEALSYIYFNSKEFAFILVWIKDRAIAISRSSTFAIAITLQFFFSREDRRSPRDRENKIAWSAIGDALLKRW